MRITLCGSTRFKDHFIECNQDLTLRGHVVYSVASFGHADECNYKDFSKLMLDAVHMAKIANSDAIAVIDVDGYIGESTRREIYFAAVMGREIHYLSESADVNFPRIKTSVLVGLDLKAPVK